MSQEATLTLAQEKLAALLAIVHTPVDPAKAEGYVPTPARVAETMLSAARDLVWLHTGARVLEPSAGNGALVLALLEHPSMVHVTAVEPNPDRLYVLRAIAAAYPGRVTVFHGTLEDYHDSPTGREFDAVVMNPPFSTPGHRYLWAEHVRLAHALLGDGGHLVAIVPTSYYDGSVAPVRALREWATPMGAQFEALDRNAFKESGTTFGTGVLRLPARMPARHDGRPTWLLDGPVMTAAPVRVDYPHVTRAGSMPVQIYSDFGRPDRIIRYAGECFGCHRAQWAHDDGDEGPQPWGCGGGLHAADYGKVGPSVAMCVNCVNAQGGRSYNAAHAAIEAGGYWADAPDAAPPAPNAHVPNVYPMDVCAGQWMTVTGLDPHGLELEGLTGELTADPEQIVHDGDYCAVLHLRTRNGCDIELHARPDVPVTLWESREHAPIMRGEARTHVATSPSLVKGVCVRVTGHDTASGEPATHTGRLEWDPKQVDHDGRRCVLMFPRDAEGRLYQLHADATARVAVLDELPPRDPAVRTQMTPAGTGVRTHTPAATPTRTPAQPEPASPADAGDPWDLFAAALER